MIFRQKLKILAKKNPATGTPVQSGSVVMLKNEAWVPHGLGSVGNRQKLNQGIGLHG